MSFENATRDEAALTLIASIWLFSGMTANVLLQVTTFLKGGDAVLAAERSVVHHGIPQMAQARMGWHKT